MKELSNLDKYTVFKIDTPILTTLILNHKSFPNDLPTLTGTTEGSSGSSGISCSVFGFLSRGMYISSESPLSSTIRSTSAASSISCDKSEM